MTKRIVTLTKPIKAHDKELTELELREPTVKEIRKLGYPFSVRGDESVDLKADVIVRYIEVLAAIPPSAVDTISSADFMEIQTLIMGFFGPATSATPENSPT